VYAQSAIAKANKKVIGRQVINALGESLGKVVWRDYDGAKLTVGASAKLTADIISNRPKNGGPKFNR
jgi:hypothetical protein